MDGNPARFALAPERMFASTAHCSRRTAHWLTSSGHVYLDSVEFSPRAAHLLLRTADPSLYTGHIDHSTVRRTTAHAQFKYSHGDVKASPHQSFIPLGHRADAHGGRLQEPRSTLSTVMTIERLQSPLEKPALRRLPCQGQRSPIRLACILDTAEAPAQFAPRAPCQRIVRQSPVPEDLVDESETRRGIVAHRDRCRTVQPNDRRRFGPHQQI